MNDKPVKPRNVRVYLPVFLFLLIFAVDKVAYIPAFRECCTRSGSSESFRTAIEYDFRQDAMIEQARRDGRRLAMNFGSSRSLGYYTAPSIAHIANDPFLTPAEKERTRRWEVVNSAAPGSSMLFSYVRFHQWLDHGVRPEAVFVEISPVALTRNTTWFITELKFGVPLSFTLNYMHEMPYDHVKTIIGSRIFELSRYRIGEAQNQVQPFEFLFRQVVDAAIVRPENAPLKPGIPAGEEPLPIQMRHKYMAETMEGLLFQRYRLDPSLESYVYLMIDRAKAEGIPIIFWLPPAHPLWREAVARQLDPKLWNRLVRKIEARGGHYVDLGKDGTVQCNQYIDPVHFSEVCVPEIFARQVQYFESTVEAKN